MLNNRFFKYTSQELFTLNSILKDRKDRYSIIAFYFQLKNNIQYFKKNDLSYFKSDKTIAGELQVSKRSTERYIAVLKKLGLVKVSPLGRKRYMTLTGIDSINDNCSKIKLGELNPIYKRLTSNDFEWILLSFIVGKCRFADARMFFTNDEMCDFFGCSYWTLKTALLNLKKKDLIEVYKVTNENNEKVRIIKVGQGFIKFYRNNLKKVNYERRV